MARMEDLVVVVVVVVVFRDKREHTLKFYGLNGLLDGEVLVGVVVVVVVVLGHQRGLHVCVRSHQLK